MYNKTCKTSAGLRVFVAYCFWGGRWESFQLFWRTSLLWLTGLGFFDSTLLKIESFFGLPIVIDRFGILWFHATQDREFLRNYFAPLCRLQKAPKVWAHCWSLRWSHREGPYFRMTWQANLQTRFKSTYCTLACILDWLFSSQVAIKHYQGHRHLSSRMPRWPQLRRCDNVTKSWNGLEPKSQKPSCHQRQWQRSFGHKADQHSGGVRAPKVRIEKV